jgi:hypothetical protein
VKSAASAIQNVIENKIKPLKENFSYLIGKSALPLLAQSVLDEEEKSTYAEDEVMQGGGIFQDRLRYLSHTARLLKDCHQELVLPLLLVTVNQSQAVINTIPQNNLQL